MLQRFTLPLLILLFSAPVFATWSVVVFDTQTQEVGVASATCISSEQFPGIDLQALSPVIVVGEGAAAVQSLIDASGERRGIIESGIRSGLSSQEIVNQLIMLPNTGAHQHGVVGAEDSSETHTGATNGQHASGVAGNDGNLYYAIQGNVLAGSEVVTMTEQTLLNTAGDVADRMMAAMETARDFGGDGRCSCGPVADACGSPPPAFDKSAHVGFFSLSRFGDTDDAVCDASGCADGDYYLNINIADQPAAADDPVDQMRDQFDTIRTGLLNRPDAAQSIVEFIEVAEGYLLNLELRDHTGQPILNSVDDVTVEHAPESANSTSIGPVQDNGDGSYSALLSLNRGTGDDVFLITIQDMGRVVIIPPRHATLRQETFFRNGFEIDD